MNEEKILKGIIIFSLLIAVLLFSLRDRSEAAIQPTLHHNVTGAAWSANIGWISMSCDTDPAGCSGPGGNYGVDIDPNNNVTGKAWSSNIGWISFGSSFTGPNNFSVNPTPSPAKYDPATGKLSGWARACGGMIASGAQYSAINNTCSGSDRTDGWDGWISLSGKATNNTPYGAKFNPGGQGAGAAWGSNVVGWINWAEVKYHAPAPIVTLSASPNYFPCNNPPTNNKITLSWTTANVTSCTASASPYNSQWVGSTPVNGSKVVANTVGSQQIFSQVYSLTCTGPGGSGSASATVSCNPVSSCPPTPDSPFTYQNPDTGQCECPPGTTYDGNSNTCKGPKGPPSFEEF